MRKLKLITFSIDFEDPNRKLIFKNVDESQWNEKSRKEYNSHYVKLKPIQEEQKFSIKKIFIKKLFE